MEHDSDANNTRRNSVSFQDAQSHLTSSEPSLLTSMTSMTALTATTEQEQSQHEVRILQSETVCMSSEDDSRNEEQQPQLISILSQEWAPPATSTPLLADTTNILRSEREIENDLFDNIQKLVQEFLSRPIVNIRIIELCDGQLAKNPKLNMSLPLLLIDRRLFSK